MNKMTHRCSDDQIMSRNLSSMESKPSSIEQQMEYALDDHKIRECRQFFQDVDENGDGVLSPQEFTKMLENMGMNLEARDIQKAYARTDKNSDGEVTFREFLNAYADIRHIGNNRKSARDRRNNSRKRISGDWINMALSSVSEEDSDISESKYIFSPQIEKEMNTDTKQQKSLQQPHSRDIRSKQSHQNQRVLELCDQEDNESLSSITSVSSSECSSAETQDKEAGTSSGTSSVAAPTLDKRTKIGCWYFWNSDTDCDGRLSMTEFSHLLHTLGMLNVSQRQLKLAFKVADKNSDSYISFMEYLMTHLNEIVPVPLTSHTITHIFHHYDEEGKGVLTEKQFRRAMRSLGHKGDELGVRKLMQFASKNSLNSKRAIFYEDFSKLLCLEQDGVPQMGEKNKENKKKI